MGCSCGEANDMGKFFFDYARIYQEKNSKRETMIYADVLIKFDATWGNNNILYHRLNSKTTWNNRAPDVGRVNQAYIVHSSRSCVVPPSLPKRVSLLFYSGPGNLMRFFGTEIKPRLNCPINFFRIHNPTTHCHHRL